MSLNQTSKSGHGVLVGVWVFFAASTNWPLMRGKIWGAVEGRDGRGISNKASCREKRVIHED